jgi:L-asparaginase
VNADTLVVLGTGGTIAGRASQVGDRHAYQAGLVAVEDLLEGVTPPPGLRLECHQVAQVDSKDMGVPVWRALLQQLQTQLGRPEVRAVVVTHGTDTAEETAFLLQRVLAPDKPIVLTCAMRPATALLSDGPQNLEDALTVAADPGARGVLLVCAGRLHSALDVQKVHTHRLDAFDSGDAGALGVIEQGRLTMWRTWPGAGSVPDTRALLPRLLANEAWPRVECLFSHAGADGALVRALLAAPEADRPHGLVVAGTGNGTLHQDLEDALRQAQAEGVAVRLTTRCANGRVVGRTASGFEALPLPPVKARLALMLTLL